MALSGLARQLDTPGSTTAEVLRQRPLRSLPRAIRYHLRLGLPADAVHVDAASEPAFSSISRNGSSSERRMISTYARPCSACGLARYRFFREDVLREDVDGEADTFFMSVSIRNRYRLVSSSIQFAYCRRNASGCSTIAPKSESKSRFRTSRMRSTYASHENEPLTSVSSKARWRTRCSVNSPISRETATSSETKSSSSVCSIASEPEDDFLADRGTAGCPTVLFENRHLLQR